MMGGPDHTRLSVYSTVPVYSTGVQYRCTGHNKADDGRSRSHQTLSTEERQQAQDIIGLFILCLGYHGWIHTAILVLLDMVKNIVEKRSMQFQFWHVKYFSMFQSPIFGNSSLAFSVLATATVGILDQSEASSQVTWSRSSNQRPVVRSRDHAWPIRGYWNDKCLFCYILLGQVVIEYE